MKLKSANPNNENIISPLLIMVMGLPGSGKTYFAKAFAKKIGAIHFNSDIIRKTAVGTGRQQQQDIYPPKLRKLWERKRTEYSETNKSVVYQTMFQKVCKSLEEQKTVVVDATFSLQQYRDPYFNYVKEHQIPLKIMLVIADESTIFKRVQQPRPDSDADFAVYKKIKSEFEPLNLEYLPLKSDQYPLDVLLEKGLAYITTNTT